MSRSRSRSAATAWPMWPRSAPSRSCSDSVASDPTVSRLFATLRRGRGRRGQRDPAGPGAEARAVLWSRRRPLGGTPSSRDGGQVIVDIDATLVTAHSDKEGAEPTYKTSASGSRRCARSSTTASMAAARPWRWTCGPGKASPWNSADHIATLDDALAQLPEPERGQVLVRADTGGASKAFLHHITDAGLEYSIGFPAQETVKAAIEAIPEQAWRAALDGDGEPRDGAQVAELTGWMPHPDQTDPSPAVGPQEWPAGMRVIARRERPHPGAQLRLTDHNGWRITCFATNTRGPGWTLPVLEVRHRQRARCRGPHPRPQRHRAAQPALPRLSPTTGSGSKSSPSPPTSSPGPRPWPSTEHRARPQVGTQTAPLPAPRRRRPHHPHRPHDDDSDYPATGPGTTSSTPAGPPAHRLNNQPAHPSHQDRRTGDHSAGNHPCPDNDDAQHHRRPSRQTAS